MGGGDWLARRFDENRTRLRAVAYRMLGSTSEAEDAVQETWLKLSRSGSEEPENLGGWLTTVVARVCLDMLRTRRSRREEPLAAAGDAPSDGTPEEELALADATGPALLAVLDALAPGERVAFVLHDTFDVSFEEIARILNRTPTAARQLASARGGGYGERKPRRLTLRNTATWSARSWQLRAMAISSGWSRCYRQRWYCEPTSAPCMQPP